MIALRTAQVFFFYFCSLLLIIPIHAWPTHEECGVSMLTPSTYNPLDGFGNAMAVQGHVAVIASSGDDSLNPTYNGTNNGAAFIFLEQSPGVWVESQKLLASDMGQHDIFGSDLDINGVTILIGAYWDDSGYNSGAAYIFTETTTDFWVETQKLKAPDKANLAWFGFSTRVLGDFMFIGSHRNHHYGPLVETADTGSMYVYMWNVGNNLWEFNQKIYAKDYQINDYFGNHVEADGYNLAVGSYRNDEGGPGLQWPIDRNDSGAVYMFYRYPDGNTSYVEVQKLVGSDSQLLHEFGINFDLLDTTLVVGAIGVSDNGAASGAAYIFVEISPHFWVEVEKLVPDDNALRDWFGYSIQLSERMLVIGAPQHYHSFYRNGAIYVFGRTTGSSFELQFEYSPPDVRQQDEFGFRLALDGQNLFISSLYYEPEIIHLNDQHHNHGGVYTMQLCYFCASTPCENGGSCVDDPLAVCTCDGDPGYEGDFCEINIDDCLSNPCGVNSTCVDLLVDYSCDCDLGYTGELCESDVDDCASSPCPANSHCIDQGENSYICPCDAGFAGAMCQTDIDDCASSPCPNGLCIDTGALSYYCDCDGTGYTGTLCSTDVDDCTSSPCLNSGVCTDSGIHAFVCDCNPHYGYEGTLCDIDIDDCASSPCPENIVCTDAGAASFTCECGDSGLTGARCEADIDDCASSPCLNDGVCTDNGVHSFMCDCSGTGFDGITCESNQACASSPCMNNGICDVVEEGLFTCDCTETGFTGSSCEELIDMPSDDACVSSPCSGNGTCTTSNDAFICECFEGYTGATCREFILDNIEDPDDDVFVPSSTAVEIEFQFTTFTDVNMDTTTFEQELPELLSRDVGGDPSDYDVAIVRADGVYTVYVIYNNPDDEDVATVQAAFAASSDLSDSTSGFVVIQTAPPSSHSAPAATLSPLSTDGLLASIVAVMCFLSY